jgi:hypothetical protein
MGRSDRFSHEGPELYLDPQEQHIELGYGNPPEYFVEAPTRTRRRFYKKLGPLIGITETNELGRLRIKIDRDPSDKIPTLKNIQGDLQTVNFLRDYYGFNVLSQEEYKLLPTQSVEVENGIEQVDLEEDITTDEQQGVQSQIEEGEQGETIMLPTDSAEVNTTNVSVEKLETRQEGIVFPDQDISNFEFNLSRYTGDDEQRLAIIEDDLEELGLSEEEIKNYISQKGIPEIPSTSIQIGDEYFDWWDRHISGYSYKELALSEYYGINLTNTAEGDQAIPVSEEVEATISNPESTSDTVLQQALQKATATLEARLGTEISLADETFISKTEMNSQELEILKQEAYEAIAVFQQFAQEHPYHTRDRATQERYREFEAAAWEAQNKLAHINGGEIFALPQKRDIELSHPEVKDTKDYLESLGYGFDENGDIITIKHHNKTIALNRPYDISNLIDSPRPAHILTDINLDNIDTDLHHTGYVLPGLNPHTPDFIVSTLSKDEFIQGVIVDDIIPEQVPVTPVSEASPELQETTPEVVASPEGEQSPINPDFGSLYYQEITLWNTIQALKERAKQKEAKDEDIDIQIEQAESDYRSFIAQLGRSEQGKSFARFLTLRTDSAYTEERNNEYGRDKNFLEKIRDKFSREDVSDPRELSPKEEEIKARNEYNQALQELLKTQVAIGVEGDIKNLFVTEVQRLRDERIVQSQELQEWDQTGLEKKANPIKEKLFNWYIKHKSTIGKVNLALFATSTALALTGAGVPVAGALEAVRRTIAYPMALASGVSSRELIRSKFEDGDINLNLNIKKFNLKTNSEFLKLKGDITKLVEESLQEGYIESATDEDLSKKFVVIDTHYRLNGNRFTSGSQEIAFKAITEELGQRVENQTNNQTNPDVEQPEEQEPTAITGQEDNVASQDNSNPIEKNPNYVSNLLEIVSEKRRTELQRQKRNRTIANVAGTVVAASLLANLAAHAITPDKPSITDTPDKPSGTSQSSGAETTTPPATKPPLAEGTESSTGMGEAAKKAAQELAQKAQELAEQKLQDISELSKGETLWGEVAKKLGDNPTDAQIQQGVEAYMNTSQGQETMFSLARETEGGSALLSEWGIHNAAELSQVSKTDLYELSRHLGVGQLKGLDTLDISNLPPLDEVSTPTGFNPAESTSSGVTPPGPGAESIPPTDTNTFVKEVSEVLGAHDMNLTEQQIKEILYAYNQTEQGRESLYNLIELNDSGSPFLSQDFSTLSADDLYEISQSIDIQNLEGFNLDSIILSKFEKAPDALNLFEGGKPLNIVDNYISKYAGDMPGSRSLGKLVLEKYVLETDEGRAWLYDAILKHEAPTSPIAFELQQAKELYFKEAIKSPEDLKKLLVDKNGFPSAQLFWDKLSRVLKPGQMPGIKKALQLVLAKQ